jgi:hypothetical protein
MSHFLITRPFLESFFRLPFCLPYVAARLLFCLSHSVESPDLLSHFAVESFGMLGAVSVRGRAVMDHRGIGTLV